MDAQSTKRILRENISSYDKRLVFLLGAGASSSVVDDKNIRLFPNLDELTAECKSAVGKLGATFISGWAAIWAECEAATGAAPNVEDVLDRVLLKREALSGTDRLSGLDSGELGQFEATVRETLVRLVHPPNIDDAPLEPHLQFSRWIASAARKFPVEVFTTNYDVLIERALEHSEVNFSDGFSGAYQPFFTPAITRQYDASSSFQAMLWKLHGSVTWKKIGDPKNGARLTRDTEVVSGELIYPSFRKHDEIEKHPFRLLIRRLLDLLGAHDSFAISSGFSFRDLHITEEICTALRSNPRSHLFAFVYGDGRVDNCIVERAQQLANVTLISKAFAIARCTRFERSAVDAYDDLYALCSFSRLGQYLSDVSS